MLKLGNLTLGSRPVIATTVGKVNEQILKKARNAGTDIIEFRIDALRQPRIPLITHIIKKIKDKNFPLILTIRKKQEGGVRYLPDAMRLFLFRELMDRVDAVDIELSSRAILSSVIALAHKKNKKVIVSFHNFKKTPSEARLKQILREAKKAGADIVKFGTMVKGRADILRLLAFTLKHRKENIITIGMGKPGSVLRIILPVMGSLITYGFVDRPRAPGQIYAGQLKKCLETYL